MAKANKSGTKKKQELFENFGEFDSYEEINEAAAGLLAEGDTESLRALADENGLSEDVDAYISGELKDLCDPVTAALGKIEVEKKQWEDPLADDVADYLVSYCDDTEFAKSVRKKGKRIREASERIVKEAEKNVIQIGGRRGNYCGPLKGYRLIREYYQEAVKND